LPETPNGIGRGRMRIPGGGTHFKAPRRNENAERARWRKEEKGNSWPNGNSSIKKTAKKVDIKGINAANMKRGANRGGKFA